METMLLRMFQYQVLLQCEFIMRAFEELNTSLQRHSELVMRAAEEFNTDVRSENQRAIFYALQNLLNAAADVSKALWGKAGDKPADRQRYEARQELRNSIGIKDTSPLRTVTVRNKFEHYDENLDKWWKQSKGRGHVDLNIGAPDRAFVGVAQRDIFRNYDQATNTVSFWGDEINIQDIINEVETMLPILIREAQKSPWER